VSDGPVDWRAEIEVRASPPHWGRWLEQALLPESAREVPRARARIARPADDRIVISIDARDSGAARAALNTYLGWIDLAVTTLRSARAGAPAPR
jgi:tRNA threonylcarbamoyladenosine modification (KEOPS) complex  Pcc1 subunit